MDIDQLENVRLGHDGSLSAGIPLRAGCWSKISQERRLASTGSRPAVTLVATSDRHRWFPEPGRKRPRESLEYSRPVSLLDP